MQAQYHAVLSVTCMGEAHLDAFLIDVHHGDVNLWAVQRNHGHGGATHVASANASDLHRRGVVESRQVVGEDGVDDKAARTYSSVQRNEQGQESG